MSRTTRRQVAVEAESLEARDLLSAVSLPATSAPAEVRRMYPMPKPWRQAAPADASPSATGEIVGPNDHVIHQTLLTSGSGPALALTSRYRPTESI